MQFSLHISLSSHWKGGGGGGGAEVIIVYDAFISEGNDVKEVLHALNKLATVSFIRSKVMQKNMYL